MKTYARIVNGHAVDVTTEDPKTIFHEDLAAQFVEVPEGTRHGDTLNDDGSWTKAPPPEVVVPVVTPPKVTPPQFKMIMLDELPTIRKLVATDDIVETFMSVIDDPRLTEVDLSLTSVQNGVKYCLKQIGWSDEQIAARMVTILSGVWS
jgi:hypothetical protein